MLDVMGAGSKMPQVLLVVRQITEKFRNRLGKLLPLVVAGARIINIILSHDSVMMHSLWGVAFLGKLPIVDDAFALVFWRLVASVFETAILVELRRRRRRRRGKGRVGGEEEEEEE